MKRLSTLCVLVSALFLVTPELASAAKEKEKKKKEAVATEAPESNSGFPKEYVCEVDIFYTWQRMLSPTSSKDSDDGGASKKQRVSKPMEVFHTRIGERGAVEVDVKNRLLSRLAGTQADARKVCETEHQAQSLCVTQKLKSLSGDYRSLDFAARRAILDSVIDDCSRNAGICTTTRSGPIACFENRPPDLPLENLPVIEEKEKEPEADTNKDKKKK